LEDICELTGDVREERKTSLLQSASLFVLPSHNEGLPIALAEGMAAGLPVISTPVGGIPEIIRNGYNGFLVPPGDADALADKLFILASDPQLRHTMGSRNREIAEQVLDVDDCAMRLQKLYESMV
jgi:glycosyltransferase involved in cell wall biosynthesis